MVTISRREYEELKALIPLFKQLQEEICLLKNGKKSNTSNTHPSHDIGRSNQQNLRKKNGEEI